MGRSNNSVSYGPITVLVLIMAYFYVVFVVALVPPLVGNWNRFPVNALYPSSDLVNLVVVHIFFALTLISFIRASCTHPGMVPPVYPFNPDCPRGSLLESAEIEEALEQRGFLNYRGIERKNDGRPRFCRICGTYKPDRAHHSTPSGTCVLELDHMCPWIRQAVGYFNKKYFFLLIFYGACSLVGFTVALGPRFFFACKRMVDVFDFFLVFGWVFALLLGIVLCVFTCFHIYLIINAYTTVEFCEKRRAPQAKTTQDISVRDLYARSPYDLGVYHNIKHVLGPVWTWLIPTRYGMPEGITAGVIFDINMDHPLYKAAQVGDLAEEVSKDERFMGASTFSGGIPHDEISPAASAAVDSNFRGRGSVQFYEQVVRRQSFPR